MKFNNKAAEITCK